MIINELYKLSQRLEADGLLPPTGYSLMAVHMYLDLDGSGKFLQWRKDANAKGTRRFVPLGGRTGTRIEPYLLTDNIPYMFGVADPKFWAKARKKGVDDATTQAILDRKHQAWLDLTRRWIACAGADPLARALGAFLDDANEVARALSEMPEGNWEVQRALIQVDGHVLQDQQSARDLWADVQEDAIVPSGITAPCIITGEMVDVAAVHKGNAILHGGKVSLVSSNCDSFSTYGAQGCTDIPMAPRVIRGYKRAFSYLGNHPEQHHYSLGDMTCLYWTDGGSKVTFDLFEPQPEQVRDLLHSYRSGKLKSASQDRMHLMLVTLNSSRLVPLAWIDESVDEFAIHVAKWFERQQFSDSRGYSLYALTRPLWPGKKPLPPHATNGILQAALTGQRLPFDFLTRALHRVSKPSEGADGSNHIRNCPRNVLSMIRMATNDYLEHPVSSTHNPNEHRPAYLCGRILATLELIQRAALPKINTTVADTWYQSASTSPGHVLPALLAAARTAHLPKLRKNQPAAHAALEKRLLECFTNFHGANFPRVLTPVEQGLFAMGYHLALAEDWARRAAYRNNNSGVEEAVEEVVALPLNDNVEYAIAAG